MIIGKNEPAKASTAPTNFQIDGPIKSNVNIFNELLFKIQRLDKIEEKSYQKIVSAIRYYRLGSETPELENKFLNYWIGLEFIFNSFLSSEKTIDRIRKYFPVCHSLIYVKRNIYDFHRTLQRLKMSENIAEFADDLSYFLISKTYDTIVKEGKNELVKYRACYFKKWHEDPGKIKDVLHRHQNNLKWNLTRLYSIRNDIVHNAAIKSNIYTHISHLKYYLSFMLNSILDYMSDAGIRSDNEDKVTIDDFFISQEIILNYLSGKKLENWLEIKNPNQIFQ